MFEGFIKGLEISFINVLQLRIKSSKSPQSYGLIRLLRGLRINGFKLKFQILSLNLPGFPRNDVRRTLFRPTRIHMYIHAYSNVPRSALN